MKIESYGIQMQSSHELTVQHKELVLRSETIRSDSPETNNRSGGARAQEQSTEGGLPHRYGLWMHLSAWSGFQYAKQSSEAYSASKVSDSGDGEPGTEQHAKLMVLLKTMEKLTGKSYHFSEIQFTIDKGVPDVSSNVQADAPSVQDPAETAPADPARNLLRQVETYTETSHYESETTAFSAAGVIRTSDGREINIGVQLNMSREFYEKNAAYTVETKPLTDPLVINWDGAAADLTANKYEFDLNSDGIKEFISFVTSGKGGFLAYDRNQDGLINDGSELFGPTTGNGFSELAGYDQDANGWIDEADQIYHDLAVWMKTADGQDQLVALADTGVGAIYLNAADTPFSVTTENNEKLGQVQRTGVYLNEDGSAGTIQQVDLASEPVSIMENNTINTVV